MQEKETGVTISDELQFDEQKNLRPFIIRGHHLNKFGYLLFGIESPEDLATSAVKTIKIDLQMAKETLIFGSDEEDESEAEEDIKYAKFESWYLPDIVGTTQEEIDTHERNTVAVYRSFLSLPDNAPVEIVEGIPDEICSTCIIGEHCKQAVNEHTDLLAQDGRNIKFFLEKAQRLDGIELIEEERKAEFTDLESQSVRVIKTTAGAVRRIITS